MSVLFDQACMGRLRLRNAGTARREPHVAHVRQCASSCQCSPTEPQTAVTGSTPQPRNMMQTCVQEPAHCRSSTYLQLAIQSDGLRGYNAVVAASIALQTLFITCSMALPEPVQAHVAIDRLLEQQQQQSAAGSQQAVSAGFDPTAAAAARSGLLHQEQPPSTTSSSSRRNPSSVKSAASEALQQLAAAEAATKAGDFQAAYQAYNTVVQKYPDLALTEYARLGRAILLYQLGDSDKSIIALEDQELSMRGYPEVHAALAAVLYAERPAQRLRAEQQWDIALEFDSRYESYDWVASNKHWPPAMLQALQKFLLLE